jgi:hypothetical protein
MHHYALPFVFLLFSCANNTKTEPAPVKVEEAESPDTASSTLASGKPEAESGAEANIELPCGDLCDAPPNTKVIITQQVDIRREQRVIQNDLQDIKSKLATLRAKKKKNRAKLKEQKKKERERKKQDESASK